MNDYYIKQDLLYAPLPETYASEVTVGNDSDDSKSDQEDGDDSDDSNQKYSDDSSDDSTEYKQMKKGLDRSYKINMKKRHHPSSDDDNYNNVPKKSKGKKKTSNDEFKPKQFVYECSLCMFKSFNDEDLKHHMVDHLDGPDTETFIEESFIENSYRCFFCPFNSSSKGVFTSHLKKTHTGSKAASSFARGKSQLQDPQYSESLSENESDHVIDNDRSKSKKAPTTNGNKSKRILICSYCSYKTEFRYRLVRHEMTHTGAKPSSCNLCPFTTVHPSTLKSHVIKVHGAENLASSDAPKVMQPKTISSPSPRKVKKASANSVSFINKRWKNTEGKFTCSYCPYRSDHKHRIRRHERIHTGEKPFACKYCDYRCNQNGYLTVHMRMHTGEKPFTCRVCSYSTNSSGTLRNHEKTHAEFKKHSGKSYSCKECQITFESKAEFKKHKSSHSGKKKKRNLMSKQKKSGATNDIVSSSTYQCSFCEFKCSTFVELSQHSQQHKSQLVEQSAKSLSKSKFRCGKCGMRFLNKNDLNVHLSKHEIKNNEDVTIELGGFVIKVSDQ